MYYIKVDDDGCQRVLLVSAFEAVANPARTSSRSFRAKDESVKVHTTYGPREFDVSFQEFEQAIIKSAVAREPLDMTPNGIRQNKNFTKNYGGLA